MTENRFITYSIIRCVDEVRDELLNVGVVALDPETGRVDVRTTDDLGRVRRTLPNVAVGHMREYLSSVSEYFTQESHPALTPERLDKLAREWGNAVRLSSPRSLMAADCSVAASELFTRYVDVALVPEEPVASASGGIQPTVTSRRIVRQVVTRLKRRGFRERRDMELNAEVSGETRAATRVPVWFPLFVSRQLLVDSMDIRHNDEQRTLDGARLLAAKAEEALRGNSTLQVALVLGESPKGSLNDVVKSVLVDEGHIDGRGPRLYWQSDVDTLVASAPFPQLSALSHPDA